MDKFIIPLILSIALAFPVLSIGQDCECIDCGQPIPINSTTDFTFEVSNLTNPTLNAPGQGVCGVVLEFRHDFIWALEIVLTSPSGQQITLVGPRVTPPLGSYTGFAYWDISFLPTVSPVSPDPPFSPVWDNDQNWQTAGRYTGSYYPSSGNLEDFTSGSANGNWTLSITNSSTFYTGFIDDFRVIFCDESGLNCPECLADAGDLSAENDVTDCEGGTALQFSPTAIYGGGIPDPTLYTYTYLIEQAGVIIDYQNPLDLSTFPPGTYTVYGFSYLTADASRLPATGTGSLAVLQNYLNDPLNPYVCGDLSTDQIIVQVDSGVLIESFDTICQGASYSFRGMNYTQTGTYNVNVSTAQACDSVFRLNLLVNDTLYTPIAASICDGESYPFDGSLLTTAGNYSATYASTSGCDSTVALSLIVNDTLFTPIAASICDGESYPFDGSLLTSAGSYSATYASASGCDSTVALSLIVNDTLFTPIAASICDGESYPFDGSLLTTAGNYSATYASASGCDSTVALSLIVNDTLFTPIAASICDGESYPFNGSLLTTAGNYSATYASTSGCDSTVALSLIVNDTLFTPIAASICDGESYPFDGSLLTSAGSYSATYASASGCDSTVVLSLSVSDTLFTPIAASICDGESYPFDGSLLINAGSYSATYASASGCDSTVTLFLSVSDTLFTPITASICTGESYPFDGSLLTTAGSYSATYASASGCDSTVALSLIVNDTLFTPIAASICDGESYPFNGSLLTIAGNYSATYASASGCDSTVALSLIVNDTLFTPIAASICDGESYPFDGSLLTNAGSYSATYTSASGCDSTVALSLIVNDTLFTPIAASICDGESYPFDGSLLTNAGSYSATYTSASGCDSTVTLSLSVSDTLFTPIAASICTGESYPFDGSLLINAGSYSATYASASGCDSTVTLSLSVSDTLFTPITASICDGESYLFDGSLLTSADSYSATYTSASGCDSTITLFLSVNDTLFTPIAASICDGESYPFDGSLLTTAGNYSATYASASGCDSTVTLSLSVSDTLFTPITASICDGESYPFDGSLLTSAGSYSATYASASGCDSTVTLSLSVSDTLFTPIAASICDGESYLFDGSLLTSAGSYSATYASASGCDSTVVLSLSVSDTLFTPIAASICDGESYPFDGSLLTSAGNYSATYASASGCDSTVTLSLSVSDTLFTPITASICDGESYLFDGSLLTSAGSYSATYASASGCDSTVTLSLSVSDTLFTPIAASICDGESYPFDGSLLTSAGNYSATYASASGCDSTVTLSLSVSDTLFTPIAASICTGGSYPFDGSLLTSAGSYSATYASASGCDSTVTLSLSVSDTLFTPIAASICTGGSYPFDGSLLTNAGNYSATYTSASGCDSVVMLSLEVGMVTEDLVRDTICEGDPYEIGDVLIGQPGSYRITLLNNQGCDSVIQLELAAISIGTEILGGGILNCMEEEVILEGNVSSNGGGVSFEWYNSSTTLMSDSSHLIVSKGDVYTLVVIDDSRGCSATESITIDENLDAPLADIAVLGPLQLDCEDSLTLLSGFGSFPLNQLELDWQRDGQFLSNDIELEVNSGGSFQLIVTDSINGCKDTSSLEIIANLNQPFVQIEEPTILNCQDSILTLDASGSSSGPQLQYLWTTSFGGNLISGENTAFPSINQPGLYLLTLEDTLSGCMDIDSVWVQANLDQPIADAGAALSVECEDLEVQLDGTASSSGPNIIYQWTGPGILNGDSSLTPVVNQSGNYTLIVTDSLSFCTAEAQVEVAFNGITGVEINQSAPNCFGDANGNIIIETITGGISPYIISFNNAPFRPRTEFNDLGAGTYTLRIQAADGCEWQDTIELSDPFALQLDLGPNQSLFLGDSIPLTPQINIPPVIIDEVTWNPSLTLNCDSCLFPVAKPLNTTTYSLTLTSDAGCIVQDEVTITVKKKDLVFVPNAFTPNGDGFNDLTNVFAGRAVDRILVYRIFDRFGEKVYEQNNFFPNDLTIGWDGNFDQQPMNPAVFVYYLEVLLIDGTTEIIKGDITLLR